MTTSSFKSTSRRPPPPSPETSTGSNTNILRRSRSVSSISRTNHKQTPTQKTDFSEFSNPLFLDSNCNGTTGNASGTTVKASGTGTTVKASGTTIKALGTSGGVNADGGRGRSVTRNGTKSGIGRSLSRVRGRSVSRAHYSSENEDFLISAHALKRTEQKQGSNTGKASSLASSQTDVLGRAKSFQATRRRNRIDYNSEDDSACSLQILSSEDANSICSLSEAEEKTTVVKHVKDSQPIHDDYWVNDPAAGGIYETVRSEVRRAISDIQNDLKDAIRRNNAPIVTPDMRSDLVNPGGIEMILDIRREYAQKLEESEERARELKADLSIEEHRGQELSKILKEILPEPKSSTSQRSHTRRKRSNERKNMSRCLTEEAMAYFDECVSISTFDSSDFSAPEDPSHGSLNSTQTSVGSHWYSQPVSQSNLAFDESGLAVNKPSVDHNVQADPALSCSSHNVVPDAEAPAEIVGPNSDIMSYAKQFKICSDSGVIDSKSRKSSYDADSYKFQGIDALFDKVLLRSRIESGGLHLCSGGLAISPFNFR